MKEKVRLVSLFAMALVVAAFARSRSRSEFALGLVALMLVGVVYFDQARSSAPTEDSLPSAVRDAPVPERNQVTEKKESTAQVFPAPDPAALIVVDATQATSECPMREEEHPADVLEKRQVMLQDYMMQPSVTRKPTSSALNAYIKSIAEHHRAENSADPSLRRM